MQLIITTVLLFAVSACAVRNPNIQKTSFPGSKLNTLPTTPSFDPQSYAGVSEPLGYFDPLGLAPEDEVLFKRFRESELKHGRISMIAVLAFYFQESGLNFGSNSIVGPAIFHYQQAESLLPAFTPNVLGLCAAVEGFNIIKGWQSPSETLSESAASGFASLKEDYVNGDLEFDPLNFKPVSAKALKRVQTQELNNGRLAMLALAGLVAQELATDKSAF